jgi:hypothetical protein
MMGFTHVTGVRLEEEDQLVEADGRMVQDQNELLYARVLAKLPAEIFAVCCPTLSRRDCGAISHIDFAV